MKQVRLLKGIIGLLMVTVIVMSGWMISDILLAANSKGTTSEVSVSGNAKQTARTFNAESLGDNNEGNARPIFTLETLKSYNGLVNEAVYIAVDGLVYDVTDLASWEGGQHMGLEAGIDLTEAFANSPHSQGILDQTKVVGEYIEVWDNAIAAASGEEAFESEDVTEEDSDGEVGVRQSQDTISLKTASSTVFNKESLSQYDGVKSNRVYIAVGGVVYDVTSIGSWVDGEHQGVKAGKDLTEAFAASPHSQSILDTGTVVGTYSNSVSGNTVVERTESEEEVTAVIAQPAQVVTPASNVFTKESLKVYNGISNSKVYIAVNGVVYDVTSIGTWTDGVHKGISAGEDVTVAFAGSPHSMSLLNQATIVGTYASNAETLVITTPVTDHQIWTSALLANYNGKNNNPSYIAVNGIIYDVSHLSAWFDGSHKGVSAGKDLTSAFASSPHSQSILDQATIVGVMNESVQMIDGIIVPIQTPQNMLINDDEDEEYDDDEHEDEEYEDDEHEDDEHEDDEHEDDEHEDEEHDDDD